MGKKKNNLMNVSLSERVVHNTFKSSTIVLIISNLTSYLGAMIDSLIVSRALGSEYLAPFQLVQPLVLVLVVLSLFFSSGLQNAYSELLGAGKFKEANKMISLTGLIMLILGVVLTILYFFGAGFFASILGAPKESGMMYTEAKGYVQGLAPGIIPVLFIPLLGFIMTLEGRPNLVYIAVGVQTLFNIVGDLLATRVFNAGLFGMGIATAICNFSFLIVIIIAIIAKPISIKFIFKELSKKDFIPVCVSGFPASADRLWVTIQMIFLNWFLLNKVSTDAVSAYAVVSTLANVFLAVAQGIGSGTYSLSSMLVGEKDNTGLKKIPATYLRFILFVEIPLTVFAVLIAPFLVAVFVSKQEAELYSLTVLALRLIVTYLTLNAIVVAATKYLLSLKKMIFAYCLPLCEALIFFIPSTFILNIFNSKLVWLSFFTADVLTLLLFIIAVSVINGHIANKLDYYTFIEDDAIDDVLLDGYAKDTKQILTLSEYVVEFCKENNSGNKLAMIMGLVVEELGSNVLKFNGEGAAIDMRIIADEEKWILRIRDNGKPFNPEKWLEIYDSKEDPAKNLGIKMISKLVDSFKYTNSLGMNSTLITVNKKAGEN